MSLTYLDCLTSYISFLGLTVCELPLATCPSGRMVIHIEGLAVGGVNPDCKSDRFIVLVLEAVCKFKKKLT
jgi:hypothetical protein